MNGYVFNDLPLYDAHLGENECISTVYSRNENPPVEADNEFLLEVSTKCGFTERPAGKNQISCLREDCGRKRNIVCCSFEKSLVINSRDFFISDRREDGVTHIILNQNSKIEFLPILVFLKFSNVQTYKADRCSIREVAKINFEHLPRLQVLNLAFNRIETLRHDTFKGLLALRNISLSNIFCH